MHYIGSLVTENIANLITKNQELNREEHKTLLAAYQTLNI